MARSVTISVIIATFNTAGTLRRTLASLHGQVQRNFEVIICDGGSTDDIENVCAQFSSFPIEFRREPDKGIYDALNKGIARATGDIIQFLGGDDALFDPLVLARISMLFAQNQQLELAYGDSLFVNGSTNRRRSHAYVTRENLIYHSLNHQAVFARRALFDRVGLFDLRYRLAADFDWLVRAFRAATAIAYLPLIVARYATTGTTADQMAKVVAEMATIRASHKDRLALLAGRLWGRLTIPTRLIDSTYPINDELSEEWLGAALARPDRDSDTK